VVAFASARSPLRFMRPLPSPLAQLSSRYNIVVYSEPRLRSVNHPYVSPFRVPPASLARPPAQPPNLPDAARREREREREKERERERERERKRKILSRLDFQHQRANAWAANQPLPRGIAGKRSSVLFVSGRCRL